MKRNVFLFSMLAVCMFMSIPQAQILWDEDGVAVRQGKHIEWYRSADSDDAGYLYVAWSDCRTGTRDIYAQKYDTDGNVLWAPDGVPVIEAGGRQEDPVIVADGAGGAIIAWVEVHGNDKCYVSCQRLDQEGALLWAEEGIPFTENSTAFSPLNITTDGEGGAYVTWKDDRSDETGDIYITRVTAEGEIPQSWPEYGKAVCSQPGEQSGASIGSDGSGGAILTWRDKRSGTNYDIYAQRVTPAGALGWESTGLAICMMPEDQDQVKLWGDGNHGAVIVWRDRRDGRYTDIYAQRIDGSGTVLWIPQGTLICGAAGNQEEPRLVHDGADGAVFTWKDHRNNSYNWDLYAQRVDGSGTKLWSPDDVAICTASGDQIEVRMTLVGTGETVFVWVDQRTESSPLGDIYVQRVNGQGAVQWTADGVPVSTAPLAQNSPILRDDGSGGVFAVWGDQRSGSLGIYTQRINEAGALQWDAAGQIVIDGISGNATHLHVEACSGGAMLVWEDGRRGALGFTTYAQKIDENGSALWAVNGVGVDTSGDASQTSPVIISDADGGAFFAWEDRRNSSIQIYAHHFDSDGTPLWPAAVRVCPTDDDQADPRIALDGHGGVVVAWSLYRSGMEYDVYAQRIDAQGMVLWDPAGIRVSSTDNDENATGCVGDGGGGSIIIWEGGQWDNKDIFALKLNGDGTHASGWPEGGLPVCTASGQQVESVMHPDGTGGAVVVWKDSRHGVTDLFAQRIDAGGARLWKTNGPDSLEGLPLCLAPNDQSSPSVSGDSQTGFIFAWHDFRTIGNGNDIYAQRLDGDGHSLWGTDGLSTVSVGGDQFNPALALAAGGGSFVVWEDNRSSETIQDIYAQKLDDTGGAQWTDDGISVIRYAKKQSDPRIVGDGQGGAIVIWEDMRSKGKADTHDIYAQRLSGASTGLRGDPTDDGIINVLDVLAALNHILDVIPLDDDGQWRADCSGDGLINVLDALGIANVILGLGTCAP